MIALANLAQVQIEQTRVSYKAVLKQAVFHHPHESVKQQSDIASCTAAL